MNEAILRWLASATIGIVVCGSLWLAGNVKHSNAPMLGRAEQRDAAPQHRSAEELRLAAARESRGAAGATAASVN